MTKRKTSIAALLVAIALTAAACGSDDGDPAGGPADADDPVDAAAEMIADDGPGIPEALRENRAQAGEILPEDSFEAKLGELRGHPVVVNKWASWCPPCRAEFPYFQQVAQELAGEVAFLGVDSQDSRGNAERFLTELPVPYPHIDDPAERVLPSVIRSFPATIYIDEDGETVFEHRGPLTREQLEGQIEEHLGVGVG